MDTNQREFLEVELSWVRSVRRGRRIQLVEPALSRERELLALLGEHDQDTEGRQRKTPKKEEVQA